MSKTLVRFFTIADYKEEETWLRKQHSKGLKLVKIVPPCFYVFEECDPQDTVYRLDCKENGQEKAEYIQMAKDFGWEYCEKCFGWLYFRKAEDKIDTEEEGELFSDNLSKIELIDHVIKTRFVPMCMLYLAILLISIFSFPYFTSRFGRNFQLAFSIIVGIDTIIYGFLAIHCGVKLKKLKNKYKR